MWKFYVNKKKKNNILNFTSLVKTYSWHAITVNG